MPWISYMRCEYLAEVDIIPPPDTKLDVLDCEFDTLPEAIDWIIQDNPRRLGARVYRGQRAGRRVMLDLIWNE